jgi:hypothetical protein
VDLVAADSRRPRRHDSHRACHAYGISLKASSTSYAPPAPAGWDGSGTTVNNVIEPAHGDGGARGGSGLRRLVLPTSLTPARRRYHLWASTRSHRQGQRTDRSRNLPRDPEGSSPPQQQVPQRADALLSVLQQRRRLPPRQRHSPLARLRTPHTTRRANPSTTACASATRHRSSADGEIAGEFPPRQRLSPTCSPRPVSSTHRHGRRPLMWRERDANRDSLP